MLEQSSRRGFLKSLARVAHERAQGLVEFAMITPVVLMFMFVIIDFGIGLNHRVIVTNDAREAARRLHRHEHGQVIFLYVMVITVFFVVAVLGIDATLWHSQRRTAQKDADAIALCAGQELFNRTTKPDMQSRVTTQSNSCASLN